MAFMPMGGRAILLLLIGSFIMKHESLLAPSRPFEVTNCLCTVAITLACHVRYKNSRYKRLATYVSALVNLPRSGHVVMFLAK